MAWERTRWYLTSDIAKSGRNGFLITAGGVREWIIRSAAVAVAHVHLGEVPAVFVAPRSGGVTVEVDAIHDYCRALLLPY